MTACRIACATTLKHHHHHHVWLTSAQLIRYDRWIGVVIALAGVLIVTDGAAARQWTTLRLASKRVVSWTWAAAKAWVHRLRGGQAVVLEVNDVVSTSDPGTAIASARGDIIITGTSTLTLEGQVGILRSQIAGVRDDLAHVQIRLGDLEQRAGQNHARASANTDELRHQLHEAKRRDRQLNDRGFLPTVIGLLLTAAPDHLLSLWGHPLVSLIFPAAGICNVVRAVVVTFELGGK